MKTSLVFNRTSLMHFVVSHDGLIKTMKHDAFRTILSSWSLFSDISLNRPQLFCIWKDRRRFETNGPEIARPKHRVRQHLLVQPSVMFIVETTESCPQACRVNRLGPTGAGPDAIATWHGQKASSSIYVFVFVCWSMMFVFLCSPACGPLYVSYNPQSPR